MKRLQLILLVMLFTAFCLTGCTSQKEETTKTESTAKKQKKKKTKKKEKKKTEESTESTEANNEDDALLGTAWDSGNDDSYWIFNEDHSFYWYKEKDIRDDNYYGGTYESYTGEKALDYIESNLSSYGLTREDILEIVDETDYNLEDFICLYTEYNTFILEGEEQISGKVENAYYGFISSDRSTLLIVNLSTGTAYPFSREE